MKRILSMLLAVVMVLSTTVMAAPFQISTVETAKEVVSEDNGTDAKLSGELIVKPGINMLTGTAEPFTRQMRQIFCPSLSPETSRTVNWKLLRDTTMPPTRH